MGGSTSPVSLRQFDGSGARCRHVGDHGTQRRLPSHCQQGPLLLGSGRPLVAAAQPDARNGVAASAPRQREPMGCWRPRGHHADVAQDGRPTLTHGGPDSYVRNNVAQTEVERLPWRPDAARQRRPTADADHGRARSRFSDAASPDARTTICRRCSTSSGGPTRIPWTERNFRMRWRPVVCASLRTSAHCGFAVVAVATDEAGTAA